MKKSLGNLALLAGVIVSSLAAAEGQRVSRTAPVDRELIGQVLHTTIASTKPEDENFVRLDRTLEAGSVLDEEMLRWLESEGLEEVLVLRHPVSTETLSVDEELVGRVLAAPVVLGAELEEIRAGRQISPAFVDRLEAAGLESVRVQLKEVDPESGSVQRREVDWDLGEGRNAELLGQVLRESVELPVQLKASSYVDDALLERLRASDLEEIEVKIPRSWSWRGWEWRWIFVIGIGLTLGGVFLKRTRLDAGALAQEQSEVARLAEALQELEARVEELATRADELDAEAIHEAVDALLLGPVYTLAEGRNSIRNAHGGRVFATVMDDFARAERRLNRAWSAAVDGYVDEARNSLRIALPSLREARESLPGTRPPRPSGFASETEQPLPPDVPLPGGGNLPGREDDWIDQ